MTDRENLIELVNNVLRCLPWGEISSHTAEDVADHLIANGVTIATDNNVGDKTNADRIRAMSDDMLAEFIILSPEMEFDVCLLCQFGNKTPRDDRGICLCGYGACDAESRADAFKKWLKQSAETENADTCVCCGAIIPEGQIVCPNCLVTVKEV